MAKRAEGGTVSLSAIPAATLKRELERRVGRAGELRRERDRLVAKIGKIESQLRQYEALGMGAPRRSGPIAVRSGTLAAALHATLKGKQMGVTEAAEAVVKDGYKTKADNFRTIVNACLLKHTDLFTKVARGLYTAA
ncbi:hypothetical protein PHYC_00773 [Phycisphaerales bacterium]|nr:hypothetical protein PHYC_00773 [Phycisphaerales bacterium]